MPLIKDGAIVEADDWSHASDDAPLPEGCCVTVTLQRFLDNASTLLARNTQAGVRLMPDDDPHRLAEYLDRIGLIEVSFPKYVDGRGYSQAQLLRRRLGYKGEMRAVGDVLRDQLLLMLRSGFDAFETKRADAVEFADAAAEFSAVYQKAADGARPAFDLRTA